MRYTTSSLLALAAVGLPIAIGAPSPQLPICATGTDYTVTSQEDVPGSPQVGDYSVSGATGTGQVTQQTTFTVGVTVEKGIDLGLSFEGIVSAGVSGSVSTTTEHGTTQGVSDTCPKGSWYCALSITPTMVRVSGTQTYVNSCGGDQEPKPFTVLMPKLGADGNPIINAEVCTCHNLKNWADPGHPALLCPANCALPSNA